MRYLISISYDGSKFNGFQKLNNQLTVQGELERVLSKLNKNTVYVKGAGRTDKGTHALDQKCHFELNFDLEPYNVIKSINDSINKSIRVNDCIKINDKVHARFSVKQKEYYYVINIGNYNPINNDYIYNYGYKIKIKKVKKAAKLFIGYHSYINFVSGKRDSYDAHIRSVKIKKKGNLIYFEFVGKSFYTYMVRNIVGSLLDVGRDKLSIQQLKDLIDNKNNEVKYSTVPACGLYLKKVDY